MLPNLLTLRSDINLLKSQSRYITLSANMAGEFRWRVDTELVTMEKQYQQLENPAVGMCTLELVYANNLVCNICLICHSGRSWNITTIP